MKMNAIIWPEGFMPGFTDNFASNEVIVAGLTAAEIWPFLSTPSRWPSYYANAANIRFHDGKGPELEKDVRFYFETFGFPVESQCTEYSPPSKDQPGRVAWHGWSGKGDSRLDIIHAWIVEDLDGGRVRVLTQESQNGQPAKDLHKAKPNPMINGHQDWLDGLVCAARNAQQA